MLSRNFWESLGKFEEAHQSRENPEKSKIPCSKTAFCRPISNRGEHPKWPEKNCDPDRQYRAVEEEAKLWNGPPLGYSFRWIVDLGEEFQNVTQFFKSFQVDYANKIITLEIYEVIDDDTWNWLWWITNLRDNADAQLKHTILNAEGDPLATTTYKFLKTVEHRIVYDYADTGVAVNRIVIEYEENDRQRHYN